MPGARFERRGGRSQRTNCNPGCSCAVDEPSVIACQFDLLSACAQEFDRPHVKAVQRCYRCWKWFEGAGEDPRKQINQRHAGNKSLGLVSVRRRETACMNSIPELVLQKPARNQRFAPNRFRRKLTLDE